MARVQGGASAVGGLSSPPMYASYFGLSKEPFSIAPDPHFLFMSDQHREALAHLLYGLGGGGGFVLLTGEVGAGKTTVCRAFLEQVPSHCDVAYIFNPKLTAVELLQTVCGEFGVALPPAEGSVKALVDALNAFLLDGHARGRQAVLVIDEAQSLAADVLEQLRLLTNLETAERKLLQIVLIGQPELRQLLARGDLEQLAQRVIARYHLGALSPAETVQYVRHRFAIAGPSARLPFDARALAELHRQSGGVPRRINLLADRSLLGAYAQGQPAVDRKTVAQAAKEVFGRDEPAARRRPWWPLGAAVAVAVGVGTALWVSRTASVGPVVAAASTPAAPAASAPSSPAPAPAAAAATPPVFDAPEALLAAAQPLPATAWRELALRWNVAIGEGDPCVAAAQAQLACFRSTNGGLALLRQVARPAVLVLRPTGSEAPLHAVLVALDERGAGFQAGTRRFTLALPELLSVWRGEFGTFWRTPPGWRDGRPLSADAAGRAWLEERLPAEASGKRLLAERVFAFQLAQGLPLDSVAGPLTLMQLNRTAGVDEPRLAAAR